MVSTVELRVKIQAAQWSLHFGPGLYSQPDKHRSRLVVHTAALLPGNELTDLKVNGSDETDCRYRTVPSIFRELMT